MTPAGNYKLTSLASGSGSNLDIVSTIVDMGAKFYLFLKEDGSDAVRFYFRFLGDSDPYFFTALQDGIEMPIIFENFGMDEEEEEEKKASDAGDAEDVSTYACKLRTHSPVVFLVFEDKSDGTKVFEAAKTVEIK